ncbi:Vacuolar protein-sorting-associated protein 24 [Umbelopsis sp. WA50703]
MASTINSIQRFFGKRTSEEMVKKWQQDIRAQNRGIERQIRNIEREEANVKTSIKQVAKRGDTKSCKSLAKELVRSRKHKDRLYTSKAQLNSVSMQLNHQLATLKIAGTLQKSTEVMTLVNQLIRLPEISKTMQEMSMEMTKAGIIDEMIGDTFEMMDDEDMEEEADEEVNKVLYQVTEGTLGEATSVANLQNPVIPTTEEEEEEPELDMMQKRLEASYIYISVHEVL